MGTDYGKEQAAKCLAVKNWRFGYNKQIVQLARLGCKDPKAALGSAKAGLEWMYENMVFASADKKLEGPFGPTVQKVTASFQTGTVKGTKSADGLKYKIPYDGGWHPSKVKSALAPRPRALARALRPTRPPAPRPLVRESLAAAPPRLQRRASLSWRRPLTRAARLPAWPGSIRATQPHPPPADAVLTGDALKKQATKWAAGGIIEPDAAEALCWTSDFFASGKSLEGVYVVMIGAGSAMGPFPKLLEMGATVVAIDIPGCWGKGGKRPTSTLWKRLCDTAKNSPGSLVFPLSKAQKDCSSEEDLYESSGCDLMKQPGEIANWLVEWQKTIPSSAKVVIGNYTYLDGDLHVKLALCADYCIQKLRKARPSTAVAFLCTPTDIHVCTSASDSAARANYGSGFGSLGLEKLANVLSGGKFLMKNFQKPVEAVDGRSLKLVDGLSVAQGPNYALAKRMQHWRAQIEFEAGATVSSMVAPSTATISVIHNKTFAWAYGGMPYFKYEIFKQETTNAVMAAMLMHDVLNTAGPKNAVNRKKFEILNSLELFSTQVRRGRAARPSAPRPSAPRLLPRCRG